MNQSYSRVDTGYCRNFIEENIIQPSQQNTRMKQIPKQLLENILTSSFAPKPLPTSLLKQRNTLTNYLNKARPLYSKRFVEIYEKAQYFRLMIFGDYCGEDKSQYIIFSQCSLAFLHSFQSKWMGFCLNVNESIYIGEFEDMKPQGQGIALFLQNKDLGLLHEFEGVWKEGQIVQGTRRTFRNDGSHILQYKGKFKNFQFEDQNGKLIRREKKLVGKFQRGQCKSRHLIESRKQV